MTSLPGRGDGEVVPGFAMPARAKRALHIDPPTSPSAIMRRACPYRGENHGPGKELQKENFTESLTPDPELENSLQRERTSR